MEENEKKAPEFEGQDQKSKMQEEFQKERDADPEEFTKTTDELSLDDSLRSNPTVSGSTFGMESSTAKFSNIGVKNQARKGDAGDLAAEDLNNVNMEKGSGGSAYSDYLNKAQNEFLSSTGQFDENARQDENNTSPDKEDKTLRPFEAMQGKRQGESGGKSEDYEGYDISGDKRPNE